MVFSNTTQAPTTEIVRFKFFHVSTREVEVIFYGEAEVGDDDVEFLRVYSFTDRLSLLPGKREWKEVFPYAEGFDPSLRRNLEAAAREATMGDTPNDYWLPCDGVELRVEDTTQRLWIACDTWLREVRSDREARGLGLKCINLVTKTGRGRYVIDTSGPASDALRELAFLAQ